jgi:hypothetical protein
MAPCVDARLSPPVEGAVAGQPPVRLLTVKPLATSGRSCPTNAPGFASLVTVASAGTRTNAARHATAGE